MTVTLCCHSVTFKNEDPGTEHSPFNSLEGEHPRLLLCKGANSPKWSGASGGLLAGWGRGSEEGRRDTNYDSWAEASIVWAGAGSKAVTNKGGTPAHTGIEDKLRAMWG